MFIYECKPANEKEINQVILEVEDIKYERVISEFRFSIISDSVEYKFHNLGESSEYSNRQLYENIKVGDELRISYVKKYGKDNRVVAASSENEIYRSIEYYNSQKRPAFIVSIAFFIITQLMLTSFIFIYVFLNHKKNI